MPMDLPAWGAGILAVGALTGALAVGWRALNALIRLLRRVGHFLDDWFGQPARGGLAATPGIPERVGVVEDHIKQMRSHLGEIDHKICAIDRHTDPAAEGPAGENPCPCGHGPDSCGNGRSDGPRDDTKG